MTKAKFISGALAGTAMMLAGLALAQDQPFGNPDDIDYAGSLWSAMSDASLAGEDAIHVKAYEGEAPHGAVLENFFTMIDFDGESREIIVKRNHAGEGVSPAAVWDAPEQYLQSITVMLVAPESESGWFWAKYLPDGSLDIAPNDAQMAGQVAGCIQCHSEAGGGDMLFSND